MKKFQKKLLIIFFAILATILVLSSKVQAMDLPQVQNVKVETTDNGDTLVTWDKVNLSNIKYYVFFKNSNQGGNGMWTEETSYTYNWPYYEGESTVEVRVEQGDEKGEFSELVKFKQGLGKITISSTYDVTDTQANILTTFVKKATGYLVYVYNENTKQYEYKAKSTDIDKSVKLTNLVPGYENKIKLKPYAEINGEIIYGKESNNIVVTNPTAPKNLKATIVASGMQLTWDKSSGAAKYEIHRGYTEDGHYDKIDTVNTNTYIDKDVYSGTNYYYRIKAVKEYSGKAYSGDLSTAVIAPYVKAPKTSIQSYNDKAIIKWSKDAYCTGYVIYRATEKNGKYEKIATIKKTTTTKYTDKKIKAKNTYYYKVKTYKKVGSKNYYSVDSNIVQKTKYAQVVIKDSSVNNSKKTITLKWQKVSGVTGYEIYRATSKNGTYKKIATIKKKSIIKYTDKKNIGIGNLYYYKIRAYKTSGSKKEYGQYSAKYKRTTGSRKQQMNKIKLKPGTTGFEDLDKEYKKIIKKVTKGKTSVYDKVKAVYKYNIENMTHDKYHCKQFNGTFAGMMKVLGIENVYCARGETTTTSGGWTEHTWAIIEINDTRYVFDTSLDRHVLDRTKKINYSKFFKTESEVKKSYKLSYYHSDAWPVQFSTGNFGFIFY